MSPCNSCILSCRSSAPWRCKLADLEIRPTQVLQRIHVEEILPSRDERESFPAVEVALFEHGLDAKGVHQSILDVSGRLLSPKAASIHRPFSHVRPQDVLF